MVRRILPSEKHWQADSDSSLKTNKRRFSLNIHPDHIKQVLNQLLNDKTIASHLISIKVTEKKKTAITRSDNIIIFFYDKQDSTEILKKQLIPYKKYTRPSHPPMMEPIDDTIQGIAFADLTINRANAGSWGLTRIKPISEALWGLKTIGKEITSNNLLEAVEERFRWRDIDPKHPQWDLHN